MKVTLQEWASQHYTPPPSIYILRQWIRRGEIHPAPEKVGSTYYVESTAKRLLADRPTLVERLRALA